MSELYHYGILGMHWGIRRYQPYGKGGYTPNNKRHNVHKLQGKKEVKIKKALNFRGFLLIKPKI